MIKLSKLPTKEDLENAILRHEFAPNYNYHALKSAVEIVEGLRGNQRRARTLQGVVVDKVVSEYTPTQPYTKPRTEKVLNERVSLLC